MSTDPAGAGAAKPPAPQDAAPVGTRRPGFAPWSDPTARPLIRFEGVSRRFGEAAAVDGLTLDIYEGELFCLLGPSGCGKTTLMRLLAGFEQPDAGRVLLGGQDLAGIPPHRRPVNMMFQSYALFPHMSVAGNVAFGLKQEGMPRGEIAARVEEMLRLVQLGGLESRRPDQLSGGQRQRVALARALAKRPKVLLLDEPLAALDKKLRQETQFELMELQARLGTTFMVVTHDQDEAMAMADRIAVMESGRVVQAGPPRDIYERPRTRFVAEFLGDVNLWQGVVAGSEGGCCLVDIPGEPEPVRVAAPDLPARTGQGAYVAVRPERIELHAGAAPNGPNAFAGRVADAAFLGDGTLYRIRLASGRIVRAAQPNDGRELAPEPRAGDPVAVSFAPDAALLLNR